MKKMMFMVMAALAIGFTSCGNKAQQAPADEVAADSAATFDVETAIGEAKDASKLQQAIEAVQAKVKEILAQNPEAAKEYVQKVQDFLKENAEKIKEFAGDNAAVQAAVSAFTEAPAESIVDGLKSTIQGTGDAIEGAAQDAADATQETVEGAVEDAKNAANNAAEAAKDAAKEAASDAVDAAADKAKKAMGL